MELDIDQLVKQQLVAEVFKSIPEDKRNEILEISLTKVLNNVFNTWNVEAAIKDDAEKYMAEYIKNSEVQVRIKAAVAKSFDSILEGMVDVFTERIESAISSKYVSLHKKNKDTNKS